MDYHADQWLTRRWETDTRYYVAEICQDLFGEWQVKRSWGGRYNLRGSSLIIHAENYAQALALLEDVTKRRQMRGYHHV